MPTLSDQLARLRWFADISQLDLAERAGVSRNTVGNLESGTGTLAILNRVAGVLGHYVTPYPSALANCRKSQGISTRRMADMSGISRPAVNAFERSGECRIETFERICEALGEAPTLSKIEPTWSTPPDLVGAVLRGLGIDRFDLDPASPSPPTVPCGAHYDEAIGGLWMPWDAHTLYLNPPYGSEVSRWLAKLRTEIAEGRTNRAVALLPYDARLSVTHDFIASADAVFCLRDRLRFGNRTYVSPQPSAVVAWGLSGTELARLAAALPAHHVITQGERSAKVAASLL